MEYFSDQCQNIIEFWSLWWINEDISKWQFLGAELYFLNRIGKGLAFVAALFLIFDVIDAKKVVSRVTDPTLYEEENIRNSLRQALGVGEDGRGFKTRFLVMLVSMFLLAIFLFVVFILLPPKVLQVLNWISVFIIFSIYTFLKAYFIVHNDTEKGVEKAKIYLAKISIRIIIFSFIVDLVCS